MARPVKIVWPKIGKPYRGFITKYRQCLDEVYDFLLHSPQAKEEVREQFEAFATAAAVPAPSLPATQAIVSNGGTVTIGGSTFTFTVAGNVITNIVVTP